MSTLTHNTRRARLAHDPSARPAGRVPPGLRLWYALWCLAGLAVMALAASDYVAHAQSARWSSTQGEVVAGLLGSASPAQALTRTRYRYTVNGVSYDGKRVRFGSELISRGEAEQVLGRFPVGQSVTVHYDPNDPASSVLDRERVSGGVIVNLLLGMLLVITALFAVMDAKRHYGARG
jgi:Protein of unknown function (DUF3592)